jgi:hypothetical protein
MNQDMIKLWLEQRPAKAPDPERTPGNLATPVIVRLDDHILAWSMTLAYTDRPHRLSFAPIPHSQSLRVLPFDSLRDPRPSRPCPPLPSTYPSPI